MDDMISQIKKRMRELKITQEQLAEKIGTTQSSIGHYINGRRKPPLEKIKLLEKYLLLTPGTLSYQEYMEIDPAQHEFKLPVLDYKDIYGYIKNGILPEGCMYKSIILVGKELKKGCFLVKIINDSMASDKKPRQSLHEGEYALVDPLAQYQVDSLVVVKIGEHTKIRQYQKDGDEGILKAYDPQIPPVAINNSVQILGKIILSYNFFD